MDYHTDQNQHRPNEVHVDTSQYVVQHQPTYVEYTQSIPMSQPVLDNTNLSHEPLSNEQKFCRNCHSVGGHDLIAPCKCNGTLKYVHRKCLDTWRTVSPNPESFLKCDVCLTPYQFQTVKGNPQCWPRMKFLFFTVTDFLATLFVWQVLVFLTAGLVALIDWNRSRDSLSVFQGWSKLSIDYVCGLVFFFFFLGLIGILILMIRCCVCMFNGCRMTGDKRYYYTYDTYYYNAHPYSMDWLFLWYFWSVWNVQPTVHVTPDPFCICCTPGCCTGFMSGTDCNFGGDCCAGFGGGSSGGNSWTGGGSSSDCGEGGAAILVCLLVVLLIIFIIIVLIGVVVGIILLVYIVFFIAMKRISILERKEKIALNYVIDLENPQGMV